MIILGIDPGTATTGIGILKVNGDDSYEVIRRGLIKTDKNGAPGKRLERIHKELSKIIDSHSPDVIAIEKVFFAANAKTAIRVGQAQGVMLLSAAQYKRKVYEYAPGTIKKSVTGDGRANKKKMQKMLRKVLGRGVRSRPGKKTHFDNEADALAVALCHAYTLKKSKGGD